MFGLKGHIRLPLEAHAWCETHKRRATAIHIRSSGSAHVTCYPQGGIMIPCICRKLSDQEFRNAFECPEPLQSAYSIPLPQS